MDYLSPTERMRYDMPRRRGKCHSAAGHIEARSLASRPDLALRGSRRGTARRLRLGQATKAPRPRRSPTIHAAGPLYSSPGGRLPRMPQPAQQLSSTTSTPSSPSVCMSLSVRRSPWSSATRERAGRSASNHPWPTSATILLARRTSRSSARVDGFVIGTRSRSAATFGRRFGSCPLDRSGPRRCVN